MISWAGCVLMGSSHEGVLTGYQTGGRCMKICLVDLRNHGMSPHSLDMSYFAMAQDVAKIVDELDLQDVCLVGHSMGGKVAMCAALLEDETMRRFLLTNLEQREGECEWRVNLRAITACWHHIVGFPDNELQGLTFNKPTMFVAGGRSNYVKLSDFPKIHTYFPQARLLSVEGAGHWVHVDDPHSVLHLITTFVKGSAEKPLLNRVVDLTDKGLALIGT
ncbi:abhydrolase domain-containing protein 11 [Clonorchis sinensis]|uniref:sn-1-specific diacylglycerol lipase ABHD11 n=1 Tax=Clonorchis sinensis TaxID=79923 RepID=G7YSC2_CLOSI|nr:abhydrolase domain-containing protein 11 [Clonorchis sinensis]